MAVLEDAEQIAIDKNSDKSFIRFSTVQRFQHFLQLISFFVLATSGLVMNIGNSGLSNRVVQWVGGFDRLLAIHLVAGTAMIWTALYHLMYLLNRSAAGNMRFTMLPTTKDLKDFAQNMKFLLGLSNVKPLFSRYSYKEKLDYLAGWWGMFIMPLTGLILWFPGQLGQFLPRWMLDVTRVIHSYEATLAILVIVVWHLFAVVWSPHIFPGSKVWLTGKITKVQLYEEHPLELRALTGKSEVPVHPASTFRLVLALVEILVYLGVLLFVLKTFLPGALR